MKGYRVAPREAVIAGLIALVLLVFLFGCAADSAKSAIASPAQIQSEIPSSQPETAKTTTGVSGTVSGELVITFDYQKQSGHASNQFAVWIEDEEGNIMRTLYVTRYTAGGGYADRPDSIPVWVHKSNLASMADEEVDMIAGATPKPGTLSYAWDLTDKNNSVITPGKYRFFVEGSLRWKNRVMYSGEIEIGGASVTTKAEAEWFYESGNNQQALSDDSPETSMIRAVTASFIPLP